MMTFLDQVAETTVFLPPRSTLIIFPTRRACQEYRKLYVDRKQKIDWLPAILPIRDLLFKLQAPVLADDLSLLLDLYEVHSRLFEKQEFSAFMAYGQQILDDFNEIDRQLINVDFLFEEINDLKELEARFAPGEEDYEYIKSFWSEFIRTPHTPLQDSFLHYWKQLPLLYREFKLHLESKQMAYEGMAWRVVAETMEQQTYFSKFSNVIFAGFYALNKTEEKVMESLKRQRKLSLFKDADTFYIKSKMHEAGMFFRRGMLADAEIPWTGDFFSVPKNSYSVKGCNGRFAIARELAASIAANKKQQNLPVDQTKVVVVLADEGLLFPLLHFCGRLGISTNPSMGFSLKHHPLIRLLHQLKSARKVDAKESNTALKLKHLQEFCAEPMFKRVFTLEELGLINEENGGKVISDFNGFFNELLFTSPVAIDEEKENIRRLLAKFKFEDKEWIQQIHVHLIRAVEDVFNTLASYEMQIERNTWWELFIESVEKIRIPFVSDQQEGIPVMGFLETRLMDYDTVFIGPLNEDILPAAAVSKSLIPYSLRKAYHLPCKEEQDAVTAYHLYRLLQRAENIFFFYNTDLNDTGGGERSRYLFQFHHEIIEKCKPTQIEYLQQESRLLSEDTFPISIPKSDEILNKLKDKYVAKVTDSRPKGISASALSSYISCSLRFYLDQIVYLRPEDTTEGLNAGHFGNVLHKSMEIAYSGKTRMEHSSFNEILPAIPDIVNRAVLEAYDKPVDSGHDYLMKGVLTELVRRIIDFDRAQTPFEIKGLESNLITSVVLEDGLVIQVKGIIDRFDFKENEFRILDYKTGKDSIKKKWTIDHLFSNPDYKLNLQLLMYCMLVVDNFSLSGLPLKAGIFRMKDFTEEITWLQDEGVDDQMMDAFRQGLKGILSEIFNAEIPFSQTTEMKRCRFCDYKALCRRQNA